MAVRKLEKGEWRAFCDFLSEALVGKHAEIEVASLALGSQIEAEWLPLMGIVYDPKDDIIEIALDGLDIMVQSPQELYVDDSLVGLVSMEVVDGEGVRRILMLRDPLMLPAPSASGSSGS